MKNFLTHVTISPLNYVDSDSVLLAVPYLQISICNLVAAVYSLELGAEFRDSKQLSLGFTGVKGLDLIGFF